MALLKTEPVATAGGAGTALTVLVAYLVASTFPNLPVEVRIAITTLIVGPVVAFVIAIARQHSFAENTLREAGLDPAAVEANANNPLIDRCTVGEEDPPPKKPLHKPRPPSHRSPSV